MADIKYGKSSDPKTSRGRRRLKRKALQIKFNNSIIFPQMPPKPSRLQMHLEKKPYTPPTIELARPLSDIANKAAISITEYRDQIERAAILFANEFNRNKDEDPYIDAMYKVVNHAHQRNPKKKW